MLLTNSNGLVSFHIIERHHNKNIITWNYPTISENTRTFLQNKCFFTRDQNDPSNFYVIVVNKNEAKAYVRQHSHENKQFAIVLISTHFEYNKFKVLSEILLKQYLKRFNPVDLVASYLKIFTTGCVDFQENGSQKSMWNLKNFKEETRCKDLISRFGIEIIFVYTALLLRRRILIYHNSIEKMQKELYTICNFISVRDMSQNLLPYIENSSEISGFSCYLAGTTNLKLISNQHLYDICINFASNEIIISSETKDVFVISRTQKEMANQLVSISEEENSKEESIKMFIDSKTEQILSQLKALCNINSNNQKMMTLQELKSKNLKPALENFLFNLAVAERRIVL